MSTQPSEQTSWIETRDRLRGRLTADANEGIAEWLDAYARAFLESDTELCDRLVTEAFAFPDSMSTLVRHRFRPGVEALRANRSADGMDRLAGESGQIGQIVRALASTTADDEAHRETLRGVVACGLKGIWLEAVGQPIDAAAAYFEAGKHSGELGDEYEKAVVHLLGRACELNPQHALAHWYLADAWRVRSTSPTPPYVDRQALEESLAAWNKGAAAHLPDSDTSWAYIARALLSEQQAQLDDPKRASFWWQAVLYYERALLLHDSEAGRWTSLARCHRLLGNERSALHATARALEQDPDDADALEERAAILADTGAFAEARVAIDRRIGFDANAESPWGLSVKAYILAHQKDYETARELMDKVIAAQPENVWNLDFKATCCWMLGDKAGARELYETILSMAGASRRLSSDDKRTYAYASYRLGKTDQAIALLNELSSDPLMEDDVSRLLGLCRLAKGEFHEAQELILRRVTNASARTLDDFLSWELFDLDAAQAIATTSEGPAVLSRIKTIVAALADRLRTSAGDSRAAAEKELLGAMRSEPEFFARDPVAAAAARATLARFQMEAARWHDAAALYAALRQADGLLPEGTIGLRRILDHIRASGQKEPDNEQLAAMPEHLREALALASEFGPEGEVGVAHRELGDALWRIGRDAEALEHFQAALALEAARDDVDLADTYARSGLAQEVHGQIHEAQENYDRALQIYRAASDRHPGEALADVCRRLLRTVSEFWTIDSDWRRFTDDRACDEATRTEFEHALESLGTYLDDVYQLAAPLDADKAAPLVTPIALEIGSAIVPLIDPESEQSQKGKFLNEDIRNMRERLQKSLGIPNLPGIRVRAQPATAEEYVILFQGALVASGAVRAGSKFVVESPDGPGSVVSGQGSSSVRDPATGRAGRWYPNTGLKSETEFILSHVETALRRHLESFLGAEEMHGLLTELQKEEPHAAFASSVLEDAHSLEALARVLRSLVREGVPITDWSNIPGAIKERGLSSVEEAVRDIRLRLKAQLPGNQDGTTHIQIPQAWERADGDAPGDGLIGASPERAHGFLVSIRKWLQSRSGRVALITDSARLRPVVRRLIAYEFPSIPVLSRDEVVNPELIVSADEMPELDAAQS